MSDTNKMVYAEDLRYIKKFTIEKINPVLEKMDDINDKVTEEFTKLDNSVTTNLTEADQLMTRLNV